MREELGPVRAGRWDWYGRGDDSLHLRPAQGTDVHGSDNSSEQVLWEFGLVVVAFLACAAIAESVLGLAGY